MGKFLVLPMIMQGSRQAFSPPEWPRAFQMKRQCGQAQLSEFLKGFTGEARSGAFPR